MSVIVNILAAIGLVVLIVYLVYYLYIYIQKKNQQRINSNIYPPQEYMQQTGIKCPDYWTNNGIDSNGNYICTNPFNIASVNTNTNCNSQKMLFAPLKTGYTLEYDNPNGLTSYNETDKYNFVSNDIPVGVTNGISRCTWINSCGASNNIQGIWSGVQNICNSPPSS